MTSKILVFAIATILTASVLALTMSNQASAQANWAVHVTRSVNEIIVMFEDPNSNNVVTKTFQLGNNHVIASHETQQAEELAVQTTKSVLGDVCLSCIGGLAAHDTQLGKELAGKLLGHVGANLGTGTGLLGGDAPLSHLNILGSGATLGQPAGNSGSLGGIASGESSHAEG